MVWIKICGITLREDAEAIVEMGADCMGFIFSTDSPRRVGLGKAGEIIKGLCHISKAGVFVNEKIEKIMLHIDTLGLDYVQLSGDEDIPYIKELRNEAGRVKIIKALRLKKYGNEETQKTSGRILEHAGHILLDSYDEYRYGGTGKTINWEGIKGLIDPQRLILSGGLYHGNVTRALEILGPSGVDASTKLEGSPGKKDLCKVEKFIKAVRVFEEQDQEKNDTKEK